MSIYYQDDLVTLYHGDCLEHPEWWTDADVLVTDPPYGMAYQSGWVRDRTDRAIAGDDTTGVRDAALHAWGNRPALIFGTWRAERPRDARTLLIWDKGLVGMGALDLPWGPSHEEIYVLGTGFVGKRGKSVLHIQGLTSTDPERFGHPTPKPVPLMETLIAHCPPGCIADPFAGSGSTLVAAKLLGRKAVGVELEEKYCEIAARRLSQGVLDFGEWSA